MGAARNTTMVTPAAICPACICVALTWSRSILLLRIAPRFGWLFRVCVDGPLRQRQPLAHVAEHHSYTGADADLADLVARGERAVGCGQIGGNTQCIVFGRLALLGIEVHQ